jgi:TrmH family RNA methyltransferase
MSGTLSQNRRRLVRRLHTRKPREREGAVLVEGVRAVGEAVAAGGDLLFAVVSPRLAGTDAGRQLRDRLDALGETLEVSDRDLDLIAATEQSQGVVVVCRQPVRGEETLPRAGDLLVLDAIQDPGNVGTLIRSAAAFGWDGVVCVSGTADPWGAKTVRASAGVVFRIPIWGVKLQQARDAFVERGTALYVASTEGHPIGDVVDRTTGSSALVLGNEGSGVRESLRGMARQTVSVPMGGAVESLNVGVAGSILMYEWMRCTK